MAAQSPPNLVTPHRVFIDTGHLVCLSKVKRGSLDGMETRSATTIAAYRALLDAMRLGAVVPVIVFEQVFEWCPAGRPEGGLEIAAVLDHAPVCYELVELTTAIVLEAAAEAVRHVRGEPLPLPAFMHDLTRPDEALTFLIDRAPRFRSAMEGGESGRLQRFWADRGVKLDNRRFRSARHLVETVASIPLLMADLDRRARAWFEEDLRLSKAARETIKGDPRGAFVQSLRRNEMLADLLRGLGVAEVLGEERWSWLEWEKCPTLDLYSRIWWRYAGGKESAAPGDQTDIAMLPAYARCAYALTEKQMRHHVCAADERYARRVFARPEELLTTIGW